MRAGIDLTVQLGPQRRAPRHKAAGEALRVGVLGDFSGRAGRGPAPCLQGLPGRRWLRVDVDTFDAVLASLAPTVVLPGSQAAPETLTLAALDDLHPDRLLARVPRLARLLELRTRLQSPATFAQAAMELGGAPPRAPGASPQTVPAAPATGADLLAAILTRGEGPTAPARGAESSPSAGAGTAVDRLVRAAVGASATAAASPDLTAGMAVVEMQIAAALHGILHGPAFQAVEALWRGVDLLVRRLPEEPAVELYLLDLSQAELSADLAPPGSATRSATAALLMETATRQLGDGRWHFLVGGYAFGQTMEDLCTLRGMGEIATALGCPWLAAAQPGVLGCRTAADLAAPARWAPPPAEWSAGWRLLRESAAAAFLVLACPRFLARLPYGPHTDPLASVPFTEVSGVEDQEQFLWANPAFLAALALAEAAAAGAPWDRQSVAESSVDDLPMFASRTADGTTAVLCGEAWLPDGAADAIVARGITPVQPVRGQDVVRLRLCALRSPS